MKFEISDYNIEIHKYLDKWIDESKYLNARLINKYATYNEPISKTYKYFLDNPYEMANIKSYIKLFISEDVVYGIVVFHYYNEKKKFFLAINPLVVNPEFMNHGIGSKLLRQIVLQAREIAGGHVDIVKADVENANIASMKIFEKMGFAKEIKNNNFIEYIYNLTEKY
ncbi:hypothetical protein BN85406180 [Alteracholeplasma palmae J233]|uniref:N-acetyltransferase domain-containing protein n=1 Tax=Alteracholeplasma palmae (strain ATCC 49389 / J233) TaxID=1318466 RepID=U4KPL1_ALTPJ|nr:GNAT family N-acetyltransferase [Alteracholeplasma palmae]CCV64195.1 hypothetical protein BN85406180 [Alteracholeplasma palmae J233]